MTDHELEQRLRDHYRALDPAVAPRDLGIRIEDAMERGGGRWAFLRGLPMLATGAAAVVLVVLVLGFRPGGFLLPASASPTAPVLSPAPSPSPSAPGSSEPSTAPSPSPTVPGSLLPGGTMPPVAATPWSSVALGALTGGPTDATITAWPTGYLALGTPPSDTSTLPAWISGDGRTWSPLPDGTFGQAIVAYAVPSANGIAVLAADANGNTTTWVSTDGTSWTSHPAPGLRLAHGDDVAGTAGGLVAIVQGTPDELAFSSDGTSWQTVSLPGPSAASVQGVTAFGRGFVAVGEPGDGTGSPIAWWSPDGMTWTRATVPAHPGDGFSDVHAAADGLVGISTTGGTPGLASFWTSSDGRTWSPGTDPLGTWQQGEGSGSANGLFLGDGTRLLGYGIRADGSPTEYWTSLDAASWTQLGLTGDTNAATSGQVTPSLMRDGILFSGGTGTWFGTATP